MNVVEDIYPAGKCKHLERYVRTAFETDHNALCSLCSTDAGERITGGLLIYAMDFDSFLKCDHS